MVTTSRSVQKKGIRKTRRTAPAKPRPENFPIAAFGASAGGLEAFTTVLENLDNNLGIAYVLIMHLSPHHKSSLCEILQTKTKMRVHTVRNGMKVRPDNVYVIPPNVQMSLIDGHLKLAPRSNVKAIGNFAVDYFFTALASIYKNNSIGIILSGNATDGTLGLKAIKAEGGITFAQDGSAKFSGMPTSAYDSGYADFVLSPVNIAKELGQLAKIPYSGMPSGKIEEKHNKNISQDAPLIRKILTIVKSKIGVDFFAHYKQAMVYRRILRRVVLKKCKTLEDYYAILETNEQEVHELYNDFLINVTAFFRDPEFFKALEKEIFPSIVRKRNATDPIRIWVAGCATGEEAYSIAINLFEFLEKNEQDISFQIFASDLDTKAIEKARLGIYPLSAMQPVPQNYVKRYFKKIDNHYQIQKKIRESCVFSEHNLLKDPPFSRMDLISCQNVLIYLEPNAQQTILRTFHYALKATGYLFLGKSETIGNATELFDSRHKKVRIYTRKDSKISRLQFPNISLSSPVSPELPEVAMQPAQEIEKDVNRLMLQRFVWPGIVLNESLNIIQFFGVTEPYLGPFVGKASFNVLRLIREDLQLDLKALLVKARKTGEAVSRERISIRQKKLTSEVTIEVVPRRVANELFFLVVFKEVAASPLKQPHMAVGRPGKSAVQSNKIIAGLEGELKQTREAIRTTNEEYEATYEELQAHNEEILSSNEELQSVNEELETSKEELQSANEELITINEELQRRNVELKESQSYAKAITDTVNSPFLVLTANLQVKSANPSFYETFKLTPEKIEGRFLYELADHAWNIPAFRKHMNELLEKKAGHIAFEFTQSFPGAGELSFIVNTYKLHAEGISKEFLILLAFDNISDIVKSNKELKRTNDHLLEFTFGASHDLQEPLRKIMVFANILSDYKHNDAYIRKYLNKINHSVERVSLLVKATVQYSSLLRGRKQEFADVDLNKTVRDICKDLELKIEEKKAVLNVGPLPTVRGEAVLMHQLFYNVIMNALIFNVHKPVINITTEEVSTDMQKAHHLAPDKQYVAICVQDNGIGFDQKYADKIFSLYQRLDDNKGVHGTGMGLAICRKIVEDHGGVIFATGEKKKGATFWILLPVAV